MRSQIPDGICWAESTQSRRRPTNSVAVRPQAARRIEAPSTDLGRPVRIRVAVRRLSMCITTSAGSGSWAWPCCSVAGSARPTVAVAAPVDPGPRTWPLAGRPAVVRPFQPPDRDWEAGHRGVDLGARTGDAVLAPAAGVVVFAGRVGGKPVISIDHGHGRRSTYEPVTAEVTVGTRVERRDGHRPVGARVALPRGLSALGTEGGEDVPRSVDPGEHRRRRAPTAARRRSRPRGPARHEPGRGPRRPLPVRPPATTRLMWRGCRDSVGRPGGAGFLRPVPGVVTSAFGMRFHPVLKRVEAARRH